MTRVLIFDSDGVSIAGQCEGASWTGGCARSTPGAPVACAGRRINVIDSAGAVRFDLRVEQDAVSCPLVALQLVGKDFGESKEGAAAQTETPPMPGSPKRRGFVRTGAGMIGAALARLRGKIKGQVPGSL